MKKTKTGTNRPTLCYIGDLPDVRVDGITKSFHYNLNILSTEYNIIHSPENATLKSNLWQKGWNMLRFWQRSQSVIHSYQPDVVYMNLPVSTEGVLKTTSLIKSIFGKKAKWVLHVHRGDFSSLLHSNLTYRKLVTSLISLVEKIIVLSEIESNQLNTQFKTDKFVYLSNTVVLPALEASGPPPDRPYLIYLSNYLKTKGIFDLLDCYQNLSLDEALYCFGSFPSRQIEKAIRAYQSDDIQIYGPVYDNNKLIALHNASCLILPSYSEGQPLVLLEAMSIGLPIIATDVGFIRELLGEDYPYLIPAHNRHALEKAIKQFSFSRDKEKISQILIQRYNQYFHPDIHKRRLLSIFTDLGD